MAKRKKWKRDWRSMGLSTRGVTKKDYDKLMKKINKIKKKYEKK